MGGDPPQELGCGLPPHIRLPPQDSEMTQLARLRLGLGVGPQTSTGMPL